LYACSFYSKSLALALKAVSLVHKHSPSLPFNGLHPRNPCNYMDYYSFTDPEGMKG